MAEGELIESINGSILNAQIWSCSGRGREAMVGPWLY